MAKVNKDYRFDKVSGNKKAMHKFSAIKSSIDDVVFNGGSSQVLC